jgi:thiosulfate reductase cytochrome b subunit
MKKIFLHPTPIRIWHWTNAGLIFLLIITGIQLRFPRVSIFHYNHAVFLHKIFGFVLVGSFLYWLTYYLITGGLKKHYMFRKKDAKGMMRQASSYTFSMFKGTTSPFTPSVHERFNPLQKIAYLSLMFIFTPVIIITGILFSDIAYFLNMITYIGGVRVLDAIHVSTGYAFLLYLVVHLYMATLGYRLTSHIKAMITGYGEEPDDPEEPHG